jgi:UDP-glucose 4-epimerase
MKCLVTGGAGFIGSHLCDALIRNGDNVIVFDDLSTGSLDNILPLFKHKNFEFVNGSILDPRALGKAMRGCEKVYHLASVVGVSLVLTEPLRALQVNAIGTEYVFECAQECRCRVLFASSSEVYGKYNSGKLREDFQHSFGPPDKLRWSYACAKAFSEYSAIARHYEHDFRVIVTRLFNTVGAGQSAAYGMVLPTMVEQALLNKPITVFGNGTQTRTFTWVGDAVRAMIALMENGSSIGEIYNIGSNEEISINELAAMVKKITSSDSPIIHIDYDDAYPPGFDEIERRVPDIGKIEKAIHFQPTMRLDAIVESVIATYSFPQTISLKP